jgi:uncharacterized protein
MTLPDTNLWLALALSKHTHHAAARRWPDVEHQPESIGFCRSTQQAFLRLVTTSAVMSLYGNAPLSNRDAWATFEAFIDDERFVMQAEPAGLTAVWKRLAALRRTSSPKLWMDAYLAAFAIATGAQIVTTDQAFLQFSGLDVLVIKA